MNNIENILYKTDEHSLTQHFYDACSNKEFRKYVDKLNACDELLMKYTSSLEDSFLECLNCQKCRGLDCCKNSEKGFVYTPAVYKNSLVFSYVICKYKQEELKRNSYKDNLSLFEMPKDIQDATFKNIYKNDNKRIPIVKYFREFIDKYNNGERPKGVYLTGSFGSGKTYLIAALFNEMAKKGIKSVLIYYPEFLRSLKAAFNSDYEEKFNYIRKIPLLLLDDIGAENCSNWSRDEILGPILQYRMDNHLPTFFTSNLSLEELEKSLAITSSGVDKLKARRIIERIKQLTITLELISENRRD